MDQFQEVAHARWKGHQGFRSVRGLKRIAESFAQAKILSQAFGTVLKRFNIFQLTT